MKSNAIRLFKQKTAVLSLIHAVVDLSCAALFFSALKGTDLWLGMVLYNACAFLCQLPMGILADRLNRNLLFGAIGVVYCNGLNFYPFWTFGAFYSLFFHTAMFATGVFLLSTGYYTLEWRDALRPMVPILLLALVAIPINHVLGPSGADYMLIYSGSGVPLYEPLAAWLAERGLRFVYTGIMLLTHIPLALLVIAVYQLIARLAAKRNVAANRRQAQHAV